MYLHLIRSRPAIVVLVALSLIGGCGRNQPTLAVAEPEPALIGAPADMFFIAHYRATDVRDHPLFPSFCDSFALFGHWDRERRRCPWDLVEQEYEKVVGFRYSWIDSVTYCVSDFANAETREPDGLIIVACRQAISKDSELCAKAKEHPTRTGFRVTEIGFLLHFPDEKTMVLVSEKSADQYLRGYARDRKAWPFDAAFLREAEQHTLLIWSRPVVASTMLKKDHELQPYSALFDSKSLTAVLDVKEKEVSASIHAKFDDGAAMAKGKEAVAEWHFHRILRVVPSTRRSS